MASFVVGALVVGALVVSALVVGALVDEFVAEHVTLFGGVHAPVLRHAGHIAPSVHNEFESRAQAWRFPTMLQMPDSAPVSWLPFNLLRSVAQGARQRRAWDEVHGGREERGERAPRAEEGASRPRSAAVHAHHFQRRHPTNFGWDRPGELVAVQAPAASRRERANGERGMKSMEAGRSEVSARRGRRKGRVGRGAQLCTHRLISAVIRPTSLGIVPLSWLSFNNLRRVPSAPTENVRWRAWRR